ncbi:MAG: DUF1015 domain-containing protein [Bacteroidetes bacterium]|nr:DUF1015 domain-containing protein [Bacteroidota bacterium]MBR3091061.1 DUF1015 domain-containing protein [Bacteroidota bacterium]
MPEFRPFKAFRPKQEFAQKVVAKPYDVLNSEEAREEVKGNPLSFLHVGKPEVDLEPGIDLHDPRVYKKAKENLQKLIDDKILVEDDDVYLYVYAQTMNGRTQYGLVGCVNKDDYWNDSIKKHEKTRKDKEEDRAEHVRVTNAHTGPIFLTMPDNAEINNIVSEIVKREPDNDLVDNMNVRHTSWVIRDKKVSTRLQEILKATKNFYIADGHHRSAAGAIVGREREKANPNHTGKEEYNYYMAVLFPASHLYIMDYNRLVVDLNGATEAEFFEKLKTVCTVEKVNTQYKPTKRGEMGMYINKTWYKLNFKPEITNIADPVERLDVSLLQKNVLNPFLGIDDPRTSKRIDFVGGIRGLGELEKRVNSGEMTVAFAMFPTSVQDLMDIADAGAIMPPKSTWFEPKLGDGMFVHFMD